MTRRQIDLIGQQFGLLTVVEQGLYKYRKDGAPRKTYNCRCVCGEIIKGVLTFNLTGGGTKSCGRCSVRTHDLSKTPTYKCWDNMIQRCTNSNRENWPDYGGRGISVCDRWRTFTNFLEDMGMKPPGMTLDRINVDGNYERENCRWADWKTQNNNKRRRK